MNVLESFFQQGFTDQISVAGTEVTVSLKGKSTSVRGVLEENRGNLQVEIGGSLYTADANILLPASFTLKELLSANVECNGSRYLITTCVRDPYVHFWNCALTKID